MEEENLKLLSKIGELERELQGEKTEKRRMQKNHIEEMRYRDKKEMVVFCVLSACVVLYACIALVTRGLFDPVM